MKLGEIWRRTLFSLSVPKCVSCKEKLSYGELALCADCYSKYKEICTRNCSRCSKILSECSCTNELLERNKVHRVIKVFRYLQREENLAANSVIYSLKKDNRQDVLEFAAGELTAALKNSLRSFDNVVFTNVPRRRSAIVKHGIDHAALLAMTVAKNLGAAYTPTLVSKAKKMQKTLRTEERIENAVFKPQKEIEGLRGKTVILVDDVITTGASISEAACIIRRVRPKEVIAASLAIVYRDWHVEPIFTFN